LQKERYNDKVLLNINIPDLEEYKIIPISLQSLIENAIKHNSYSQNMPLKINITRDNDDIIISNNIQRKNIIENSTKIGLQNLKERVRLILDKELIFKEENDSFIVIMPVVKT
jgi:LytS/YehU family sensor histidine kinase